MSAYRNGEQNNNIDLLNIDVYEKKISEITIIPTIKMVLLFQIISFLNKKQLM